MRFFVNYAIGCDLRSIVRNRAIAYISEGLYSRVEAGSVSSMIYLDIVCPLWIDSNVKPFYLLKARQSIC